VGIYRYDQWSKTWTEWDEGLPNVAVVGLRWTDDGSSGGILRAVTHGRGIWERPVDAVSTPAVDLYMRHSDLDDGRLPVSTAAIPVARRPLRVVGGYGYEHQGLITPDVKLDTPFLSNNTWVYQFSDPAIDFAQFARFDVLPFGGRPISDCYPVVGAPVRIYVQLRNRGHRTAGTVTARVFLCNTRVSPLPNLPSDFWTAFPNSDPSPSANWSAIGPAQTVSNLRQGIPQILKFDWTPSALSGPATRGQALLVVITSSDDPVSETSLSPSDFVPRNKHTVIKPVDLSSVPNVSNTSPGPFRSPVSGGVIVSLSGSGFTGGRVVFEGEWYGGLVTIDGITTGPLTDPWGAGPTDSAVTALVPHTIFTPGRPGSVFVRSLGGDSNKLTFTWDTV
jgi:hypothetical protein